MQAEFKPVYKKMLVEKLKRENDQKEKKEDHADTSDAAVDKEVDTAWNKMDGDGDGSLTVSELAKFYGFSLEEDKTNEMTDDQILEALQVRGDGLGLGLGIGLGFGLAGGVSGWRR